MTRQKTNKNTYQAQPYYRDRNGKNNIRRVTAVHSTGMPSKSRQTQESEFLSRYVVHPATYASSGSADQLHWTFTDSREYCCVRKPATRPRSANILLTPTSLSSHGIVFTNQDVTLRGFEKTVSIKTSPSSKSEKATTRQIPNNLKCFKKRTLLCHKRTWRWLLREDQTQVHRQTDVKKSPRDLDQLLLT